MPETLPCQWCGTRYAVNKTGPGVQKKYCSIACRDKASRRRHKATNAKYRMAHYYREKEKKRKESLQLEKDK